jgi:hypothetical protein
MASITSANAIMMLSITSLYPVPQQIQGFSTDDVFAVDALDSAEVMMGVDGRLSSGFKFVPIKLSIHLQADSNGNPIFDNWWAAQQQAKDNFPAGMIISLPAIAMQYQLNRGFLTGYPPIPDAGKTLKPRKYEITFESFNYAPVV